MSDVLLMVLSTNPDSYNKVKELILECINEEQAIMDDIRRVDDDHECDEWRETLKLAREQLMAWAEI